MLFWSSQPTHKSPFTLHPTVLHLEGKPHCNLNYEALKLHSVEGLEIFKGSPLVLAQCEHTGVLVSTGIPSYDEYTSNYKNINLSNNSTLILIDLNPRIQVPKIPEENLNTLF